MLKPRSKATEGVIPFAECPAKTCDDGSPGTRVFDHCRYAGAIAELLSQWMPVQLTGLLPQNIGLLVALHDLGKVSPGYLGKYFLPLLEKYSPTWANICRNMGANTNHAEVGAESLRDYLGVLDKNPAVQAIAAHHGYRPMTIGMLTDKNEWQPERIKLLHALEKDFGRKLNADDTEVVRADLLTGLTCVADWLASDESLFPPNEAPLDSDQLACRINKLLKECGFFPPKIRPGLSFQDVFQFKPRPEQLALIDAAHSPGLYILEASMGSGKTEAALYAAYQLMDSGVNSGLYFALPTRLTSDKVHRRTQMFINSILDTRQPVKLAHGQAWLKEYEYGNQDEGEVRTPVWFSPAKRGLLYPFSVGTIDQALLSVMNVKHSFVRLLGLAGKVVILDEVHSYDLYTGTILDSLVHALREIGCTVIILSATLTAARRLKLLKNADNPGNAYPLVSGLSTGSSLPTFSSPQAHQQDKRMEINWLFGDASAIIANALQQARMGCNVVCIANTVKKAQLWYRTLLADLHENDRSNLKYALLHSRFPQFRRGHLEDEWIAALGKDGSTRPTGSILIATQILEQSVDIDADYMISELAPVDMLMQRMGRLWRHERQGRATDNPVFTITMEKNPNTLTRFDEKSLQECTGTGSWFVYAPYVLLRTFEEMIDMKAIVIPGNIRFLLEKVYDSIPVSFKSDLHQQLQKKMLIKQETLASRAISAGVNVCSLPIRSDDDENPPTRYNSHRTVNLLILRNIDLAYSRDTVAMTLLNGELVYVNQYKKDMIVTRKLYQNLVAVPLTTDLVDDKKDATILQQHFFSSEMPIICVLDADGMHLIRKGGTIRSHWAYRDDFGVFECSDDGVAGDEAINWQKNNNLPPSADFEFKEGEDW